MRYSRLGRTGLHVSELSLGTVEIGLKDYEIQATGPHTHQDDGGAARLLHGALDLGVNLIDTARGYGQAEAIIGRTLQDRRSEFALMSKVTQDSARVEESVLQSLSALQTDCIEIMFLHCAPHDLDYDEATVDALEKLRSQGRIQYIGASVYGEECTLNVIRSGRFDCVQIAYSALDRRPELVILPEAVSRDIGVIARSVLLKGALSARCMYLHEKLMPLKLAVERIASLIEGGLSATPELAYRYVLGNPAVHSALVGTTNLAELEKNVDYASRGVLPAHVADAIDAITVDPALLNPANWPNMS